MANEERDRFEMRLDGFLQQRFKVVMEAKTDSGQPLFNNRADAVRVAMDRLAQDVEAGKFSTKGRTLKLE